MAETKELNLEEFFENLQKLEEVKDLIKAEKENTKTNDFNVFSVLGLETKEVKLHSKLLAELLNPKGSHGMESIFLDRFLKKLNESFSREKLDESFSREKLDGATVEIEKDTGSLGRIDIFIETNNDVIVIENKIYAGDQEQQLKRYKEFLEEKYKDKNRTILYLTLYGTEPSEYSTGKINNETHNFWDCISYCNTIKNWLNECVKIQDLHENIKIGINQYLEVINILTPHKSLFENKKSDEIKNLINDCPIIKQNYYELLWCLKEYSLVSLFSGYQVEYNTLLWNKGSLLTIYIGKKDNCTIYFYIEFANANYTNMTYGIWITGGTIDKRANFMKELEENNPKQSGNATWTVKTLPKEYLNSNMSINFSKLEGIKKIFEEEIKKIKYINSDSSNDFTSLLKTYYEKQEHINEIINFIEPDNKKNNKNNNIYEYIPYLEKIEYEWNNS